MLWVKGARAIKKERVVGVLGAGCQGNEEREKGGEQGRENWGCWQEAVGRGEREGRG